MPFNAVQSNQPNMLCIIEEGRAEKTSSFTISIKSASMPLAYQNKSNSNEWNERQNKLGNVMNCGRILAVTLVQVRLHVFIIQKTLLAINQNFVITTFKMLNLSIPD